MNKPMSYNEATTINKDIYVPYTLVEIEKLKNSHDITVLMQRRLIATIENSLKEKIYYGE